MKQLFTNLNEPYPLEKNYRTAIPKLLLFSLLVYFILVVFQPFGLKDHHSSNLLIYSAGFVLLGFSYLLFHLLIIESLFKESSWNLGKEILNQYFIIFILGTINAIYYSVYEDDKLSWIVILVFVFYTLVISIFPVTILLIIRKNLLLRIYLKKSNNINIPRNLDSNRSSDDCIVKLRSKNFKETYSINCSNLILILSQDNYVQLYLYENNQLQKVLLRNTMKQCAMNIKNFHMFYRCHRSYIVNLNCIELVEGNAQGLKLKLKNVEDRIPVSRKLIKEFSSKMSA